MADPFVAEIRMFGGNFPPRGWAFCNGQILPISQNTALFSLLGTTYGGNGSSTFALPNLQGRAAMGTGQGPGLSPRDLGETAGSPSVTLIVNEIPAHNHPANAVGGNGNSSSPNGAIWSAAGSGRTPDNAYSGSGGTQMNPATISPTGGSQPHNNLPPYLAVNFIIALQGIFPPRS